MVGVALALAHIAVANSELRERPTMALKMVRYRDAVSFPLPVAWKVEDEPGVQGIFYNDAPGAGTLRVSALQWQGSNEEERNDIAKNILLPGEIETLAQGVYLKTEVKDGLEGGVALILHRWLVVLALPENTCRLVVYTHTVTADQEKEPSIVAELETVDFAVRNAAYSSEPHLPLLDKP